MITIVDNNNIQNSIFTKEEDLFCPVCPVCGDNTIITSTLKDNKIITVSVCKTCGYIINY